MATYFTPTSVGAPKDPIFDPYKDLEWARLQSQNMNAAQDRRARVAMANQANATQRAGTLGQLALAEQGLNQRQGQFESTQALDRERMAQAQGQFEQQQSLREAAQQLEAEYKQGQLAIGQAQMQLQGQLGMGQLALGQQRILQDQQQQGSLDAFRQQQLGLQEQQLGFQQQNAEANRIAQQQMQERQLGATAEQARLNRAADFTRTAMTTQGQMRKQMLEAEKARTKELTGPLPAEKAKAVAVLSVGMDALDEFNNVIGNVGLGDVASSNLPQALQTKDAKQYNVARKTLASAILRFESGAALTENEIKEMLDLVPAFSDDAETRDLKTRLIKRKIGGAITASVGAERASQYLGGGQQQQQAGAAGPQAPQAPDFGAFGDLVGGR